jgi:hypothetical protein
VSYEGGGRADKIKKYILFYNFDVLKLLTIGIKSFFVGRRRRIIWSCRCL